MLSKGELQDLIIMLKAHGVTKFSDGTGLSLEFASVGSFQVFGADGKPVSAVDDNPERLPPPEPADPALRAMFDRLPAGYKQAFELGS